MPDILHRFTIDAPRERVHDLIASKEGVERWWTGHPNTADDGTLRIFFGSDDPAAVMRVVEDTPERIVWRVVDGPATGSAPRSRSRSGGAPTTARRCCSRTATGVRPTNSCTAAAATGAPT